MKALNAKERAWDGRRAVWKSTKVLADFDAVAAERHYRNYFETAYAQWDGLVPVPNFWEIGGPFPLYIEYGYVKEVAAGQRREGNRGQWPWDAGKDSWDRAGLR